MFDDKDWQHEFEKVVAFPHSLWSVPSKGREMKKFFELYLKLWRGVRMRDYNSKAPLIFPVCILACKPGVTRARDIKRKMAERMRMWREGKVEGLVNKAVNWAAARAAASYDSDNKKKITYR